MAKIRDERTKLFEKKKEVSSRHFFFSHKFYSEEKLTFIIKKITYLAETYLVLI